MLRQAPLLLLRLVDKLRHPQSSDCVSYTRPVGGGRNEGGGLSGIRGGGIVEWADWTGSNAVGVATIVMLVTA